jgi:hypothetical protein
MMRWLKAITVWMIVILAWEYIAVIPNNPGQYSNSMSLLFAAPIAITIAMVYYVIKIFKVCQEPVRKVNH